MAIVLYSYYRSSASYRVRIVLNLKKIDYTICTVHLVKNGGQQHQQDYLSLNPQGFVPVLEVDDKVISQSTAIVEYLEESYPNPPMLPSAAIDRAYVRSLVQIIACDIHPLNNLRVLEYLKKTSDFENARPIWYCHWIREGFAALEQQLSLHANKGLFCYRDTPGMADAFLIPQVYNALRFECDMNPYPLISAIYENCNQLKAFVNASPENQPDAELS